MCRVLQAADAYRQVMVYGSMVSESRRVAAWSRGRAPLIRPPFWNWPLQVTVKRRAVGYIQYVLYVLYVLYVSMSVCPVSAVGHIQLVLMYCLSLFAHELHN